MIKIVANEIKKLWRKQDFLLYVLMALFINFLLLYYDATQNNSRIENTAYKKIGEELSSKNLREQYSFVDEKYSDIEKIRQIDYAVEIFQYDPAEYTRLVTVDYADFFEDYKDIYKNKTYLEFTSSMEKESAFLSEIKLDIERVKDYPDFLEDLQEKAKILSGLSIFSGKDTYNNKNLSKTALAFKSMDGVKIEYFPQKGLYSALNFSQTDIILIAIMFLVSFVLISEEKDSSMLGYIRSTGRGRGKTAIAKIIAMIFSLAIAVVALYTVNLLFFDNVYGLGPLGRSIQSLSFLNRSILKLDVKQYIILFMFIKWCACSIVGIWILFCMYISNNLVSGVLLSLSFPSLQLVIRLIIPATHKLNLLKYANIISIMNTNEVLGRYRNLYGPGNTPVNILTAEGVFAIILFVVFVFLFVHTFSSTYKKNAVRTSQGLSGFSKNLFSKHNTVLGQEFYKILIGTGGAVFIVLYLFYIVHTSATEKNYFDIDELNYARYMKEITGKYDNKAYEFLQDAKEEFSPIYERNGALTTGKINDRDYQMILNANYALNQKYQVFIRVLNKLSYIKSFPGAHLVYETGYYKLFGFDDEERFYSESIFATLAVILILSGIFSMEKTSGMKRIIFITPQGRKDTVRAKIMVGITISATIAILSYLPRLFQVARGYGFKGIFSPAMSLERYRNLPGFVPILFIILFAILSRMLACITIAFVCMAFSQGSSSFLYAMMKTSFFSLLPLIMRSIGFTTIENVSILSFFKAPLLMTDTISIIKLLVYTVISIELIFFCKNYIYDSFCENMEN